MNHADVDRRLEGSRLGRFLLLRMIGRGGMGAVYLAEQEQPRRQVAVKVVRNSVFSPSSVRRFDYESQVLARLDHPGIAKVFEAGLAKVGAETLPYFAMEYVEGEPLSAYAARNELSRERKIRILVALCEAVQHAHSKGVIHRDLKPANVLVAAEDNLKVLDFGLAKVIGLGGDGNAGSDEATMMTQMGQVLGTVPYMSPEQVTGRVEDVDTSSDVYTLGVIAFELLSGRMPYDVKGRSLPFAIRTICESEQTRLSREDRTLRGDLEVIVAKAMNREKQGRYLTAQAMADDLSRYRRGEPIAAVGPKLTYVLRKYAARNKPIAIATAVVLAALLTSVGVSLGYAGRARRSASVAEDQRARAESALSTVETQRKVADELAAAAQASAALAQAESMRADEQRKQAETLRVTAEASAKRAESSAGEAKSERDRANEQARLVLERQRDLENAQALALERLGQADAVALFLTESIMGRLTPESMPDASQRALILSHLIDPAASEIHTQFADQPRIESAVREALAQIYLSAGRFDDAESNAREGLRLCEAPKGAPLSVENIRLQCILVQSLSAKGNLHEAAEAATSLDLALASSQLATTVDGIRARIAYAKAKGGLPAAAHAWNDAKHHLGEDAPITLSALATYALYEQGASHYAEADTLYREAVERLIRVHGERHPQTLAALNGLAVNLRYQHRNVDALATVERAVAGRLALLGNTHPDSLRSLSTKALILVDLKRFEEANKLHREVLKARRNILGDKHRETLTSVNNLGQCLLKDNKVREAEPFFREAAEGAIANPDMGPEHPSTIRYGQWWSNCLRRLGQTAEADAVDRRFKLTGRPTTTESP